MAFDVEGFKKSEHKLTPVLLVLTLSFFAIFIIYGTYSLAEVYASIQPKIAQFLPGILSKISEYSFLLIFIPIVTVIVGFIFSLGSLRLYRSIGAYLIHFVVIFDLILMVLLFLFSLIFFPPFAIVAGIFLLIIIGMIVWARKAIERAVKFLGMSAQLVMEEKELLIPPIFLLIVEFYLILAFFGFVLKISALQGVSIFDALINYTIASQYILMFAALGFISTFVYFWLIGINVAITYIWYRGKDPDFEDGVRVATSRLPAIITFSLYTALVYAIRATLVAIASKARKAGYMIGYVGAGIAEGLLADIWRGINYFTLQSIIIERTKASRAIKKSLYMLVKYIPDVIAKEIFVSDVINFITLLIILSFAGIGILAAFLIRGPLWTYVIFPAIGIVFGSIPIIVMVHALTVGYHTILYSWALDQEGAAKSPYRIPTAVAETIARLIRYHKEEGPIKKCKICGKSEEIWRCQKCGKIVCEVHTKVELGKIYCESCAPKGMTKIFRQII